MPDFGSQFPRLANDRKLTDEDLITAVRFMIAAEYGAAQLYMQLAAESTDNQLAIGVLRDIADEEIVHASEFLLRLCQLAPRRGKTLCGGSIRSRCIDHENEVSNPKDKMRWGPENHIKYVDSASKK